MTDTKRWSPLEFFFLICKPQTPDLMLRVCLQALLVSTVVHSGPLEKDRFIKKIL